MNTTEWYLQGWIEKLKINRRYYTPIPTKKNENTRKKLDPHNVWLKNHPRSKWIQKHTTTALTDAYGNLESTGAQRPDLASGLYS
ncbi:unnamed protein product [Didymodactylos carnosus]|uniref:Uncharacterized protein n=1 Tax=Didymodactylos carnosus TaxID=1234261 RepID=A0A815PAF6_9BILA|nr:unnamed protein product [Didymodactylos carnosus]CAF4320833.1 unnamed protein product [Didymodactylos carnosus]